MSHRPIMIMAGGTGGHVYPALAVANYLRDQGRPVLWLGTTQGLEARVVPEQGFKLLTIQVGGLRGKGVVRWLLAPVVIGWAILQALVILIKYRPAAVLGMGGFASGPGGLAAWLCRIPLCIHEQNAIAGLTNRLLAPMARRIMQAFPGTFKVTDHTLTTGNPVRDDIRKVPAPEARFAQDKQTTNLLVIGGSLGARALNEIVPEVLVMLKGKTALKVRHQTGPNHFETTQACYREHGIEAELLAYIEDMSAAYAWADIVVCRAGAMTIAELTAVGVASILVPFPYAVDDHQTANARFLSDRGGAILIPESELSTDRLTAVLLELIQTKDRLLTMARIARGLAKPKATEEVAAVCLEVAYA